MCIARASSKSMTKRNDEEEKYETTRRMENLLKTKRDRVSTMLLPQSSHC